MVESRLTADDEGTKKDQKNNSMDTTAASAKPEENGEIEINSDDQPNTITDNEDDSKGSKQEKVNPQDATLHHNSSNVDIITSGSHDANAAITADNNSEEIVDYADFSVTVHADLSSEESVVVHERTKPNESQPPKRRRMRSRMVAIESSPSSTASTVTSKGLPSPSNQYECTLVRRAIKPLPPNKSDSIGIEEDGIYGDVSLGMKLTVAETGEVIVQKVIPLSDGRASPAQLTGVIRRGDILLAIDGVAAISLSNLDVLRAPDTGECQRSYKLRFAAGAGHEMLQKIEQPATSRNNARLDPATEMLGLFPMVDQLSGTPMFQEMPQQKELESAATSSVTDTASEKKMADTALTTMKDRISSIDAQISSTLSTLRLKDQTHYLAATERGAKLLEVYHPSNFDYQTLLTNKERLQLGLRAMAGAKNVLKQVENIDAGKDLRSFQSWNTTLSLYSRASTRRRRVFDSASLPLNFGRLDEDHKEDDDDSDINVGGSTSGDSSGGSEQMDGDELLLRLAAHDEIWRKQVIEFLEKVAKEPEHNVFNEDDEEKEATEDIDAAMSNELGNFLFGENMTKILAKHKTPRSLPSEEVTAVLFDLTTKLSASVPDEITASNSVFLSTRSGLTPFTGMKRHPAGSDYVLATRFLLDEALPAWLKSFRPLAWEHRRILWPVDRQRNGGSTAASTLSDDTSLTLDSVNMSVSQSTRPKKRKKDIREIIEDQEMNIETRGETCFLTTYYFIHALLPQLMRPYGANVDDFENKKSNEEVTNFVKEYGSYLKLHTCLAYAAVLNATDVVDLLLGVARYDPRHREVIRQTSKSTSMVYYEPTMLSAVLQLVKNIQKETNKERRQGIIDLCAAAYPDVRPWQVRRACLTSVADTKIAPSHRETMNNLYYSYLSLVMHSSDGHEAARKDPDLVKEWCERSVRDLDDCKDLTLKKIRKDNFFAVASRASSHHRVYYRDLSLMLKLSMDVKEFDLALDLVGEILDDPKVKKRDSLDIGLVREQLRIIGSSALDSVDRENGSRLLKRVLRLFEKKTLRGYANVPVEILNLLNHRMTSNVRTTLDSDLLELIRFLAEEAIPVDVFQALALCEFSTNSHPELLPFLRTLLSRGTITGSELSASLLRIKRARRRLGPGFNEDASGERAQDILIHAKGRDSSQQSIWKRMATGMVNLDK